MFGLVLSSQGEQKDLLFLLTERYKLCVLEYDASSGELRPAESHRRLGVSPATLSSLPTVSAAAPYICFFAPRQSLDV